MSQPQHLPKPVPGPKHYQSPPRRHRGWRPNRPGDLPADQVDLRPVGVQGPDQGFALRLARLLEPELCLSDGEHLDDATCGCVGVALKRASLFGRAPTVHDVRAAFSLFGYLDPQAESELVTWRRRVFEEVSHPHHYAERRAIADAVPSELLRRPHDEICAAVGEWREFAARMVMA